MNISPTGSHSENSIDVFQKIQLMYFGKVEEGLNYICAFPITHCHCSVLRYQKPGRPGRLAVAEISCSANKIQLFFHYFQNVRISRKHWIISKMIDH